VRVLLDTHAFLWAVLEPGKLTRSARDVLESEATEVIVSAVSAWEIATKYRLGKLPGAISVMENYAAAIQGLKARQLSITPAHALKAGSYSQSHRDPFDRLLAAQAEIEGLTLVTCDAALEQFGVARLW